MLGMARSIAKRGGVRLHREENNRTAYNRRPIACVPKCMHLDDDSHDVES